MPNVVSHVTSDRSSGRKLFQELGNHIFLLGVVSQDALLKGLRAVLDDLVLEDILLQLEGRFHRLMWLSAAQAKVIQYSAIYIIHTVVSRPSCTVLPSTPNGKNQQNAKGTRVF